MKRIEQLDHEDWDVDVRTYKKALPLLNEVLLKTAIFV